MFDDLAAYYQEKVVTDYTLYRDQCTDGKAGASRDLRAAMVSAESLFHLREHLTAPPFTRSDAERHCHDFALLGDVVNVSKHRNLNRDTPHGPPLVSSATQISEVMEFVRYQDSKGYYSHVHKSVLIKLNDGSTRKMIEVLTNVMNFWEKYLFTRGIITSNRVFAHDEVIRFRSRNECIGEEFTILIQRGVRLRLSMSVYEFDNNTKIAKRVKLGKSGQYLGVHDISACFKFKAEVVDIV